MAKKESEFDKVIAHIQSGNNQVIGAYKAAKKYAKETKPSDVPGDIISKISEIREGNRIKQDTRYANDPIKAAGEDGLDAGMMASLGGLGADYLGGTESVAKMASKGEGATAKFADRIKSKFKSVTPKEAKETIKNNKADELYKGSDIRTVKGKGGEIKGSVKPDTMKTRKLQMKDFNNKAEGKETSEEGFTTRGKPIGEKIGDQGGTRRK